MSDIAMCKGTDCPIKEQCERFTAKPNEYRQSYFTTIPGKSKDGWFSCEMFCGEPQDAIFNQIKNITNGLPME